MAIITAKISKFWKATVTTFLLRTILAKLTRINEKLFKKTEEPKIH